MGCGDAGYREKPLLSSIKSMMLDQEGQQLVVYEVRRLRADIFSITFETSGYIGVGSVLQFGDYLAHVVNASERYIKIFLQYDDDLRISVNQKYRLYLTPTPFPKIDSPSVILAHYYAIPLALYLHMQSPCQDNEFVICCHRTEDLLYQERLARLKAHVVCTGASQNCHVLADTLPEKVLTDLLSETPRTVYAIGPLWLLRQAQDVTKRLRCQAHGLFNLYGRAQKRDYRWLNLWTEKTDSYTEFDASELYFGERFTEFPNEAAGAAKIKPSAQYLFGNKSISM